MLVIPTNPKARVMVVQKGVWEKLLCTDCESKLSRWEKYAQTLLFGGRMDGITVKEGREFSTVVGIDYHTFKLFQLSILWRAAVSTLDMFSAVDIPEHQESLRKMIIEERPGLPHEFGCAMMSLIQGEELMDDIVQPCLVEIGGINCFRFIMGGFSWMFVASASARNISLKDLFVQPNGELTIIHSRVGDLPFYQRDTEKLKARLFDVMRAYTGKKNRLTNPSRRKRSK